MLLLIAAIYPLSCSSKDEVIADRAADENKGLKDVSPFPFGASLSISLLKARVPYRNVVTKEYNSITAENAILSILPKIPGFGVMPIIW